jgi:hypothetical protein
LENVNCDGTSDVVIDNFNCFIYLDTLIVEPYNLVLDESIQVKILAKNSYGQSEQSTAGNGATI